MAGLFDWLCARGGSCHADPSVSLAVLEECGLGDSTLEAGSPLVEVVTLGRGV